MKRHKIGLIIIPITTISLAGCLTNSPQSPAETATSETSVSTTSAFTEPGTETTEIGGGKVMATVVSDPPEDATVVAFTDDRIGNSSLLEDVLREAHRMADGSINMDGEQMEQVSKALADAPRYDSDKSGYYIEYESDTIQVVLVRYA